MKLHVEKRVLLGFLVTALVLAILGIYSFVSTQRLIKTEKLLTHTTRVINNAEQLIKAIVDIETGQRGYVITSETTFLKPFHESSKNLYPYLNTLDSLTANSITQQKRAHELRGLIQKKMSWSHEVSKAREESFEKARDLVASGDGNKITDDIRALISDLQQEEGDSFREENAISEHNLRQFQYSFLGLAIAIAIIIVYLFYVINKSLKARDEVEGKLKEYQYFFNNNHDLVCIASTEGYFETLNPKWEKVLGYSQKEMLEKQFLEFIHPDDIDSTLEEVEKLKTGVITINFVNRYRQKDGGYLWFDWNSTPNPATGKIYAIARDITERKKLEEALMKTLKDVSDYKFALDESSIVAVTDRKGIIKFANDNFCKISKYSREELLGQDHRIISSGYHPKEFIRDLWVTIAKGKVWRGELRNKAKDETIYWVDTTIIPFLNEQGNPYQYIAIRADITERKKTEYEIKQLNQELEAFTYSVSHDLRAPLRSISGYTQMLKEDYSDKLDEEGNRVMHIIINNARRMGQLIDDLLDFSRLGRKELLHVHVNMEGLVQDVVQEFVTQENKRQLNINILPLKPAKADHSMIHQVWINLISNALKYSRNREITEIEIGFNKRGNQTCYYIRDNGVGFDMRYVDKLFGVFQRLHKMNEFEGTGVGLALVKTIVNRHGGNVWAEGKLNEGATFYFTLPDGDHESSK